MRLSTFQLFHTLNPPKKKTICVRKNAKISQRTDTCVQHFAKKNTPPFFFLSPHPRSVSALPPSVLHYQLHFFFYFPIFFDFIPTKRPHCPPDMPFLFFSSLPPSSPIPSLTLSDTQAISTLHHACCRTRLVHNGCSAEFRR